MSNSGKIFNFLTALLIHNKKNKQTNKKKTFMGVSVEWLELTPHNAADLCCMSHPSLSTV